MTSNFVAEVCGNGNLSCDECGGMVTSRAAVGARQFSRAESGFVADCGSEARYEVADITARSSANFASRSRTWRGDAVGDPGASNLETF